VEQHLYRLAEEALSNSVRHANAKHLSLSLRQSNSELRLTISDDGVGFEAEKVLAHERAELNKRHEHTGKYGLTGMQERAMLIGGFLTIRSKPMQGTTIQLCVHTHKKVKLSS
jgi:signal transduction histidine kinase